MRKHEKISITNENEYNRYLAVCYKRAHRKKEGGGGGSGLGQKFCRNSTSIVGFYLERGKNERNSIMDLRGNNAHIVNRR